LIDDPGRVFFTTDHPNGAPFTTYSDLLALLMSRDLRAEWLAGMPRSVAEMTTLGSISREYTLEEIAIMTRVAPAKLLGLADRGHLAPGARADIAVYEDQNDRARMFRDAHLVFKDGALVVRDGTVTHYRAGCTLEARPNFDHGIERRLDAYYDEVYRAPRDLFTVAADALPQTACFEEVGLNA
jgi:formylmethanofuran dehydrogenase subunit A